MAKTELSYGIHACRHLLESNAENIVEVWAQQDTRGQGLKELLQSIEQAGLSIQWVQRKSLEKMAEGGRHQGIAMRSKARKVLDENDLEDLLERSEKTPFLLILDGVQDPHNLGACLRTADAAGVLAVIVPVHRGVGITSTVRKVATGAAESVPLIQVNNLARLLDLLKQRGIWLIGTAGEATTSLHEQDLTGPLALVMGAEDKGMRRLTREACDALIHIPMQGVVESLNVSTATAVCLYEAVRQRLKT